MAIVAAPFGSAFSQTLQPERFEESLNPEVKVSGATRAGVLIDALTKPETLQSLIVHVPTQTTSTRVCVDLVTRDGRYQAAMEVSLPSEHGPMIEIVYPTRFQEQLLESEEPYLAALATLKDDCADEADAYAAAAWKRSAAFESVHVLINAGHSDARIAIPASDGSVRRFPCRAIESDPTIAFDRLCEIEPSADLKPLEARIERDDFFNPLPPVPLPLAF